jgi:hypothetical protein
MSKTIKATHSVAVFKRRGFVVVEVEAETIEAYTEARALRIVSAHPAMVRLGLPVLLAWIDDDDDLALHGDEDAAEAAEDMGLDHESIKWTQEIKVTWPDVDDEDADDEASEDEDDEIGEDEEEDDDADVDDDDADDEDEEEAGEDGEDPPVIAPKTTAVAVKPARTPKK